MTHKSTFCLLSLICCLVFLAVERGHAQEISEKWPEVRVPINHFPPWVIVEGENVDGIDLDITRAMLAELKLSPHFVPCPWTRCLKLMEIGQGDMMLGLFRSPEREVYLDFVDTPYYVDPPKAFYTHKSRPFLIRNLADLKPLTVGVILNTLYFPEFDEAKDLHRYEVTENEVLIRMLKAGRLDTFVSTPMHIDLLLESAGMQEEFSKQTLEGSESALSFVATSKQTALSGLHDQVARQIRDWQASGRLPKIIDTAMRRLHKSTLTNQNQPPISDHTPNSLPDGSVN